MESGNNNSTATANPEPTRSGQDRRLVGARVGWIALTLLVLTLSAFALPTAYALLQTVCQPGTTCLSFQLTQADPSLLQRLGLSSGTHCAPRQA